MHQKSTVISLVIFSNFRRIGRAISNIRSTMGPDRSKFRGNFRSIEQSAFILAKPHCPPAEVLAISETCSSMPSFQCSTVNAAPGSSGHPPQMSLRLPWRQWCLRGSDWLDLYGISRVCPFTSIRLRSRAWSVCIKVKEDKDGREQREVCRRVVMTICRTSVTLSRRQPVCQ